MQILFLRGGEDVVIPEVDDCVNIENPGYIDNERILRFLNDKYSKFNINGIIYITKEALCYLAEKEGLIDFPIVFLEQVKIDGIYSFIKVFSECSVLSIGTIMAVAGIVKPHIAIVLSGYTWLHIHAIQILQPSVKNVEKLTGKYVPRIGDRKDSIVFDAKKELPPAIEKSVKSVKTGEFNTEFEITESKIVDISKVSGLNNKFSDRRFKRPNRKPYGKIVKFADKIREWAKESEVNEEQKSTIDKMIEEGII